MQKEACGCAQHARDGGVLPDSGFPRDGGMAKERHRKDNSNTVQTYRTSHTTKHAFVHGRSSRGYTFEACISGGTSSSREVVIHGP